MELHVKNCSYNCTKRADNGLPFCMQHMGYIMTYLSPYLQNYYVK